MKNKASAFLKQVMCWLGSVAKAKTMAIKSKTSAAKARFIMFSLMKSKKVLVGSISDKIHGLLGHTVKRSIVGDDKEEDEDEDDDVVSSDYCDMDKSKSIISYINASAAMEPHSTQLLLLEHAKDDGEDDDDDDDDGNKYPDLRHSLFEEEDFDDDEGGSIIDLVRNSKEEGEDFSLEEEIDHVADLFIKRFHKQMRLQKLDSFKRFQEMLARGV